MDLELLKKLSEAFGPSGSEEEVREILEEELKKITDEVKTDSLGNLIAHIPGNGPRLLIAAHMDEVGFIVRKIDPEGFLKFFTLGSITPELAYGQAVVIKDKEGNKHHGIIGSLPPHIVNNNKNVAGDIEEMFIDLGLPPDEVNSRIEPGCVAVFDTSFKDIGNAIVGKAFDDRLGCFVMIEAVKSAAKINCDLWLAGTVQEESGLRGIGPACFRVKPDYGLVLEGTIANDLPGVAIDKKLASLGYGPTLRLIDKVIITDKLMVKHIRQIAERKGIAHQIIVKRAGTTDATVMQTTGMGTKVSAISVPTRYIHSPNSLALKSDIENAIKLTAAFIEEPE